MPAQRDTVQRFFAEKDDKGGHRSQGVRTPAIRKALRHSGPYTIEAASSCERNGSSVDRYGNVHPLYAQKGGFGAVRLYDKRAVSTENETGIVNEKRFQADDWFEVEAEFNRLVGLIKRGESVPKGT